MTAPTHHKEFVSYLRGQITGHFSAANYRDDHGQRPVMIGEFGPASNRFYSTIGICDQQLNIPEGRYELAAVGKLPWLPNALVSSTYWLRERSIGDWPMVCEDVVRQNVKSTYRHMAFVPSGYAHKVSSGSPIRWLLGVPITDADIGLTLSEAFKRAAPSYPSWLVTGDA